MLKIRAPKSHNCQHFLRVGFPDNCFELNCISDGQYLHHIYYDTVLCDSNYTTAELGLYLYTFFYFKLF